MKSNPVNRLPILVLNLFFLFYAEILLELKFWCRKISDNQIFQLFSIVFQKNLLFYSYGTSPEAANC